MSSVRFPPLDSLARSHPDGSAASIRDSRSRPAQPHPPALSNPVAAVAASPHRSREHSPTRSRAESPLHDDIDAAAAARARAAAAEGASSAGGPPPSLSHLVSASLAAAASHERAILKWARDIQREVDEYKASIIKGANAKHSDAAGAAAANKGRQRKKATAADPMSAQIGKLTSVDPAFIRGSSLSPSRRAAPSGSRIARSDFFGSSSAANFMRDDIVSIHPRGGKGRFLPKNLVKVSGDGSMSAREAPTSPRAIAQSFGNAALYHHRATVIARKKAAAEAAVARAAQAAEAAAAESHGAGATQGNGHLIAAMYGATAIPPSAHVPAPTAQAALQSLPPALAPVDPDVAGVEIDESASFKSPALYMDMRMRQLFHPDSSSTSGPLSSSQKAHVMIHLVDVLGELVEPDSQQAFQVLNDTLKQLILAADYKNLIAVQGHSGSSSNAGKSHSTGMASSTAAGSSAALAAQHKELFRLDRLKWDAQGNLKASAETRDPKTLMQALADGSLDKKMPAGLSKLERLKAERIKERERLDRERAEREAQMKKSESSGSSDPRDSDPAARRKPLPHIAFEGDFVDGGGVANSSVAPGAVVPWKPATGVGSHAAAPLARASPAVLANLRQIPASALDVAWTLKADVESLCARLDAVAAARASLESECAKPLSEDQSYLQTWSSKKSLQNALYARSEVMLSNEIVILKHLLVDLKEDLESVNEQNIALEEDYLAHGLVFGGSFAMESFRHEEETRNYPFELSRAQKTMEKTVGHIEDLKRDLAEIHTERDLLLTRIEVLEQAVSMMHNDEEEDDEESDEDEAQGADAAEKKKLNAAKAKDPPLLDPTGYPFLQQHASDLRGRGSSNLTLPPFLRFDGWFPRLHYSKQEVEIRIKEIWSLKTIADEKAKQVGQNTQTLVQYFQEYLEKRFLKGAKMQEEEDPKAAAASNAAATADPVESSVASPVSPSSLSSLSRLYPLHSFVANFFATLESYASSDQDFILFLKVVYGDCHEAHYRDQMKMLANFKESMWRWDRNEHVNSKRTTTTASAAATTGGSSVAHHSAIDGLIGLETFTAGLRQFFPHKSARHIAELRAILERDCMTTTTLPGSAVPVTLVDTRKILGAGEDEAATAAGVDAASGSADLPDASDALGSTYSSNFLEAVRAQYLTEIESFVARIRMDLMALAEVRRIEKARAAAAAAAAAAEDESAPRIKPVDRSDARIPMLSAYDIRSVLRAADPHRSTDALTDLLRRGCNEPYLSKDTDVSVSRFMSNLTSSGLVHITDHWRRIAAKTPSIDAAARDAAMAEEEKRAAALADEHKSFMHASASRPYFARRASLEDEAVYLAARSAGGPAR